MFRQVAKGHGGIIDGTGVISWKTRERGVASMIMADFAGFSLGNISSNPQFNFLNTLNVLNNDQSEAFNFLNTDDSDSPYNLSTFHCTVIAMMKLNIAKHLKVRNDCQLCLLMCKVCLLNSLI